MTDIPRPEYPRPQFVRNEWINLNGTAWTFEFDFGKSGIARGCHKATGFDTAINVPFCPESTLSGIGHTDFIEQLFYHRKLEIPADWEGKRILLHFGAVDYECVGYLNGVEVGRHTGGSSSFTFDLTGKALPGNTYDFVLFVKDDVRSGNQMSGKQSPRYESHGCFYTRVTGIWQTVWLEPVAMYGLKRCFITPDLDNGMFHFKPELYQEKPGMRLQIKVKAGGQEVGSAEMAAVSGMSCSVALSFINAWAPGNPFLYDIEYTLTDNGTVIDQVSSYCGLRKIHIEGNKVFLNNKQFYFRLVLDQGFYRTGIWTAPTDADLKQDIELSMACGFNGARLHQKVFEDRFHYWADKLGYITWGESPSWGVYFLAPRWGDGVAHTMEQYWCSYGRFKMEWREIMEQCTNHPSIVAWSPANETAHMERIDYYKSTLTDIYDMTKLIDPTRPCNETSGYHHVKTDLWTVHAYRKDAESLKKTLTGEEQGSKYPVFMLTPDFEYEAYKGQPYINDEFGGFMYLPPDKTGRFAENTWGYYGMEIKNDDEFLAKIKEQTIVMAELPDFSGYCYTQLTDVEQEQNGVLTYDRVPKAPLQKLRDAFCVNPEWFE